MLNNDKEKALSVSKSVFPLSITTSSFNNLYHNVRSVKDNDKQLEELADTRARYYIEHRKPSDYISLFELGGLNYQA
jgi:hypothetical protein